jgi:hypothetical protein
VVTPENLGALTRTQIQSELERRGIPPHVLKKEAVDQLRDVLGDSTPPEHGTRIEVLFQSPKKWFRGTYFVQGKKHCINYDDGEERYVTDWNDVVWREAISNRTRKSGLPLNK